MRGFHWAGLTLVAIVEAQEVELLTDMLRQLDHMLDGRDHSTDPLAELTGMTMGPSSTPDDPAVARLLPNFCTEDEHLSAGLRILHEPTLVAAKKTAIEMMRNSLPDGGGPVQFTEDLARAWMQAVNDLRLVIATRLDIDCDEYEPGDDPEQVTMYQAYQWLSMLLETLVETRGGPQ